MKDIEQIAAEIIDNQKTVFVGSIDSEGFPNIKAMLKENARALKRIT